MTYTIESDPYLSAKVKTELAEAKADGVDMSQVERFLRETAPLVAPIPARRSLAPIFAIVAAAISVGLFAAVLLGG